MSRLGQIFPFLLTLSGKIFFKWVEGYPETYTETFKRYLDPFFYAYVSFMYDSVKKKWLWKTKNSVEDNVSVALLVLGILKEELV